jgi:hypothetical protein
MVPTRVNSARGVKLMATLAHADKLMRVTHRPS